MHLLEKEPDNRYQTADGLVHDLEAVRDAPAGAPLAAIGDARLPAAAAPAVAARRTRRARSATLQEAFEEALTGRLSRRADQRRAGGRQDGAGR